MMTSGKAADTFMGASHPAPLTKPKFQILMPHRISVLSRMLRSPGRILALMLLVVFAVEVVVMTLLPLFVPQSLNETGKAMVDAGLLTLVCAPVLWWLIVGPLRRIAVSEHARSEMIVANAGEGIITLNSDGIITSVNRAACQLFGKKCSEMNGSHISRFVLGVSVDEQTSTQQTQATGIRQDGSQFPLRLSLSRSPSEAEISFIAILQDLTELQRIEEQKVHAAREREALRTQQMATLAQLATGVAHEIRNPLTSIKMLIQVNRDHFAESGLATEDLDLVVHEIRRMERSINGLLEYGRPDQQELSNFAIADVIGKTVRLIRGRCDESDVEINVSIPDSVSTINGDAAQIQQLLLNLSLNALDAMPDGGVLNFSVKETDEQIEVVVTDSGIGIDESVLEKLFSPFITTKPDGVGLGLGICRRIAESHGGTLEGTNRPEGGAEFRLSLPRLQHADLPDDRSAVGAR